MKNTISNSLVKNLIDGMAVYGELTAEYLR